ncbi:MAG: translation initiation factor IF-3 [Planctomycetota bacterium]
MNNDIKSKEVRLIDENGEQAGLIHIEEALERANNAGLDLVEVAPNANPPVCKIMDFGKFKYEQKKKAHDSKKHHHVVHIKEIRLRPRTDKHDILVKARHAHEFLEKGNKVLVTMFFKGREAAHTAIGKEHIDEFIKAVEDVAKIEKDSAAERDRISILLAPKEIHPKREQHTKQPPIEKDVINSEENQQDNQQEK